MDMLVFLTKHGPTTRLESLGLNEQLSNALFLSLHKDAPQKIFKQRLDEYDDFIAAIIYGLRSRR